ncbi:hypothetical protein Pmar_PMAR019680, partial [Perkinsus marinus ATCC 50983]
EGGSGEFHEKAMECARQRKARRLLTLMVDLSPCFTVSTVLLYGIYCLLSIVLASMIRVTDLCMRAVPK